MSSNLLNEVDVQVGLALCRLRTEASLSVDDLAGSLEIDAGRLALIEAGARRASSDLLIKAAKHFGVSTAAFYKGLA